MKNLWICPGFLLILFAGRLIAVESSALERVKVRASWTTSSGNRSIILDKGSSDLSSLHNLRLDDLVIPDLRSVTSEHIAALRLHNLWIGGPSNVNLTFLQGVALEGLDIAEAGSIESNMSNILAMQDCKWIGIGRFRAFTFRQFIAAYGPPDQRQDGAREVWAYQREGVNCRLIGRSVGDILREVPVKTFALSQKGDGISLTVIEERLRDLLSDTESIVLGGLPLGVTPDLDASRVVVMFEDGELATLWLGKETGRIDTAKGHGWFVYKGRVPDNDPKRQKKPIVVVVDVSSYLVSPALVGKKPHELWKGKKITAIECMGAGDNWQGLRQRIAACIFSSSELIATNGLLPDDLLHDIGATVFLDDNCVLQIMAGRHGATITAREGSAFLPNIDGEKSSSAPSDGGDKTK